jgi:hypothetical protein
VLLAALTEKSMGSATARLLAVRSAPMKGSTTVDQTDKLMAAQ